MAETQSKADRERAWWDAWWAEDYSWEGLAKAPWLGWRILADGSLVEAGEDAQAPAGSRHATLQDYWRDQEGDLIASPDGARKFTRVHLPLVWRNGKSTGKDNWPDDALDAILEPRLRAARETSGAGEWYQRGLVGADRRAQLHGAVLLQAARHPENNATPVHARFTCAAFLRKPNFGFQAFASEADFDRAGFFGNAMFLGARFTGNASFKGTAFFAYANFIEASFGADAIFWATNFIGGSNFQRASFSANAIYPASLFSGETTFDAASIAGEANFANATFADSATFEGMTVAGDADFSGGVNAEAPSTSFKGARFARAFKCRAHEFHCMAIFEDVSFGGPVQFGAAMFGKLASFERITWPSDARDWHGAFDQALFVGTAVFTGAGFGSFAAFDGAVLERGITFDEASSVNAADARFRIERRGALAAAQADVQGKGPKLAELRNSRLAQLERGCRVLKQAMEKASNKTREQHFYRYELIARRAQGATPLSEKLFSWLYDLVGNYGASIGRPFIAVTLLTLLLAVVYWGLDAGFAGSVGLAHGDMDADLQRAAAFSASRIFPFGAFEDVSKDWLKAYEASHGTLAALGVRILASLQSTVALTLVFVLGLAVRRKFQIT